MKTLSKLLVAVWLLGVVDANAELKRFLLKFPDKTGGEKTISGFKVNADEVVSVKTLSNAKHPDDGSKIKAVVDYGDGFIVHYHLNALNGIFSAETQYPVIIGPAEIKFFRNGGGRTNDGYDAALSYDLQKTTTSSSSPSLPSNTVVIPTDASGPVEIVMESSKDLVNWTRAEPGTYGTDTPKRFFRIRAVVKP
jgi:hypothetical protein